MAFNPKEIRIPKGQPGGGQWGSARNASAAKAQHNPKAMKAADHFAGLPVAQRTSYLKGLSDADLEALTGVVYSHRTSDPAVVAMRIAVANEMTKRGIDIKKFGALGGGLSAPKGAPKRAVPKKAAVQWAAKRASHVKAAAPSPATRRPGLRAV